MAKLAWIAFTPVKATALHLVGEADLLESGVRDDRRFYVTTGQGRLINDKDDGRLQRVWADYDPGLDSLTLRFPDGETVSAGVERGEEIVTSFFREPRPATVVGGPFADALSSYLGAAALLVEPPTQVQDRAPAGAATLLSTGSLAALAAALGVGDVDPRRFRMNLGVEGVEPHAEDAWRGRSVRVGGAVVIPNGNVGRCAVTTQNPETGKADLDTLKALAAYRGAVETTEPLPFGVHASVAVPGRVRVGDPVELV